MNIATYFIEGKGLFGPYPDQRDIKELEEQNVKYFIDLTEYGEMPYEYVTSYIYIRYGIKDTKVPSNMLTFTKFIISLEDILKQLKNNEKIYIHCKGGHGRTCIVVAILLAKIFGLSAEEAMRKTTEYHKKRVYMKDKWRHTLCPNGKVQRMFVYNTLKPFYMTKKYAHNIGFSRDSIHSVNISGLGLFSSSEAAYQAYKAIDNYQYVINQKLSTTPIQSKNLAKSIKIRNDWNNVKHDILFKILLYKFSQNPQIQYKLLSTSFKKIMKYSSDSNQHKSPTYSSSRFEILEDDTPSSIQKVLEDPVENIHCLTLMKVRESLYKSMSMKDLEDLCMKLNHSVPKCELIGSLSLAPNEFECRC